MFLIGDFEFVESDSDFFHQLSLSLSHTVDLRQSHVWLKTEASKQHESDRQKTYTQVVQNVLRSIKPRYDPRYDPRSVWGSMVIEI